MDNSNNIYSFTTLPETSSLLCLNAIIEKGECIKISTYNSIMIKCRQLLFENQNIIAYPELDQSYCVVIVVKESYYTEVNLKDVLIKYNLKLTGPPKAVSRYTYERCCYYTILTKIAPQWNIIANYFVKGRNFLMDNRPTDCAYLTIRINDKGETTFIVNTGRVKLPTMSLKALDLAYKHIQNLNTKQFTEILENESKLVRVLPSLKKGRIISISQNLSHSKTFSEYKYMKRYWKNTYGYRLPEQDTDLLYFDIKFFDGSPIFTYLLLCVRPYNPVFLKKINSEEIANEFMTDMIKAVPILLGENYKTPVFGQPNLGLTSISQMLNNPPVLYTQGNHFDFNQNISDTQNSAIVLMKTFKTQYNMPQTQYKTQTETQSISQFCRELEKQESLCNNKEDQGPNDTNNNNDDTTRNKNITESHTEDKIHTEPALMNSTEANITKILNNPIKHQKENIRPTSSGVKKLGMCNVIKTSAPTSSKSGRDSKSESSINITSNSIVEKIKKKPLKNINIPRSSNSRYNSLNITIESQFEDFNQNVPEKKKK